MPPQGIEPWIFGIRDRRLTTWPQKRCLEGKIRDIILAYLTYFTRLTNQASLNRNTDAFLNYGRLDVRKSENIGCLDFETSNSNQTSLNRNTDVFLIYGRPLIRKHQVSRF